ncbi:hypothetical protein MSPP1_000071 [Malassezia sp. CBS 17886]|nr:hypothetical protein MSPP1_000071 [Malassezia sp. CBS 17886]
MYYYYSLGTCVILLSLLLVAYWQRARLVACLPAATQREARAALRRWIPGMGYRELRGFDWNAAADAGLSSSLFDIEANIHDGDARAGLDEAGVHDVHRLMQEYGITFDEARLRRHRALLSKNNVDPQTGMPLDAKAVTRL